VYIVQLYEQYYQIGPYKLLGGIMESSGGGGVVFLFV